MRSGHAKFFGTKVRDRRQDLNLTHESLRKAGGPTGPTIVRAEAGRLTEPRPTTLAKFDAGLQWRQGSAARTYWEGVEPIPARDSGGRRLIPTEGVIPMTMTQALDLMNVHKQVNHLYETDPDAYTDLEPIVRGINQHVSTVVGLFVTNILELNYDDVGGGVHPLLENAFGEVLSAEVDDHDPSRDDKRYRRWLMHQLDGVEAAEERKFRSRLRRAREGQA